MKSTFAAELARSLVGGSAFLSCPQLQVRQRLRPVLIIQPEIHDGNFDQRMQEMGLRIRGIAEFVDDYSAPLQLNGVGLALLRETVEHYRYAALILDPIGRMWPETHPPTGAAFDENSKAHVTWVLEELLRLGITTIMIHHDPKPKERGFRPRASGSHALLNIPDTRIFIDRDEKDPDWLEVEVRSRNVARVLLGRGHRLGRMNVHADDDRRLRVRARG